MKEHIVQPMCPQEYGSQGMVVTACSRCPSGWNRKQRRCDANTGADIFDDVEADKIPDCPIMASCQHNMQDGICVVRLKGLICESALSTVMSREQAANHPLSFNADYL